jgi:hypothetical protein
MLLDRPLTPDLASAIRERDRKKIEELLNATELVQGDIGPSQEYTMVLKKKRMEGFLKQALREAGYKDLAAKVRFQRVTEEGDE